MTEQKIDFPATRVEGDKWFYKNQTLGAYRFSGNDTAIWIWMPGPLDKEGNSTVKSARFSLIPGDGPSWDWNKNRDKPTLTPSLHLPGVWHGYLTNGEFESL